MEEAPLLGGMSSPEEMVTDLFSADSPFVSENLTLRAPVVVKHEEGEFHMFQDAYLSPADPTEPLLHAFSPPLQADCETQGKAEQGGRAVNLLGINGCFYLFVLKEARRGGPVPPQPPPPPKPFVASLVGFTPSTERPALEAGWRVGSWGPGSKVEIKEAGGAVISNNSEEATFQNALGPEPCHTFESSQEAEEAAGCSLKKDSNPMVICQLKGGTQMLCVDNSGTRELKALHLVPQYPDQNNYLQSDVPKPMTTLVGRFLPVPAKLNLVTQLDNGALPSIVNGSTVPSGSTLPGPPKISLAGYCDCFASGDFCHDCNCNNCCNNLRHEVQRFKAIKACLDRNPEAFQPKIGKGKPGDVKPRHNKGCNCRRSGCLKNYCECYEAKIMCSSICKCIGCKNYEEGPERKTLMSMPYHPDAGGFEGSPHLSPTESAGLPQFRKDRRPSCISWEVVEGTCSCLLAQGEEAEKERCSERLAEQMILEEFGRCLSQILRMEFQSKGLEIE
uniref:Testis expressed metallothionein like protein n=1 Tax=Panthera tigris altaica TaxID=74533 RepID=A0A8C9JQG4_PANTA